MHCKTCGQKNRDNAVYCLNDGTYLGNGAPEIVLGKSDGAFCKGCGNPMDSKHLYCKECGSSAFERVIRKKRVTKPEQGVLNALSAQGTYNPILSCAYAIIGFIFVLIIASMLSGYLNESFTEEIGLSFNIKLIKPLDVSMFLNLISLKIKLAGGDFEYSFFKVKAGIAVFALVPAFIFFVLGIVHGQLKKKSSAIFNIKEIIITSATYALLLGIIVLLYKGKTDIPIPFFDSSFRLEKSYSFISAILSGLTLSALPFMTGYGLHGLTRKNKGAYQPFPWLFYGTNLLFINLALLTLILFITNRLDPNPPIYFLDDNILSVPAGLQASIFGLILISFGKFSIDTGYEIYRYNLFNYDNAFFYGEERFIILVLIASLIIPFVTFFIYGLMSKKTDNKKYFYACIVYGIGVAIIGALFQSYVYGTGSMEIIDDIVDHNISLRISLFSTLIGGCASGVLPALSGYLLGKRREA
ncbi:MAG: zinc ribbon domain-containing protein [Anaerovoracaceae bacterium]